MPEGQAGPLDPGGSFDLWMVENGGYLGGGCLGVISVVLIGYGCWSIGESFRARRIAREMPTWPSVPGEVTYSKLSQRTSTDTGLSTYYTPDIRYTYTVDGKQYESQRILPAIFDESIDLTWANQWVNAYPVGMAVEVFYDPKRPQDALLDRRTVGNNRTANDRLGCGLMWLLIGLATAYGVWWASGRARIS